MLGVLLTTGVIVTTTVACLAISKTLAYRKLEKKTKAARQHAEDVRRFKEKFKTINEQSS